MDLKGVAEIVPYGYMDIKPFLHTHSGLQGQVFPSTAWLIERIFFLITKPCHGRRGLGRRDCVRHGCVQGGRDPGGHVHGAHVHGGCFRGVRVRPGRVCPRTVLRS